MSSQASESSILRGDRMDFADMSAEPEGVPDSVAMAARFEALRYSLAEDVAMVSSADGRYEFGEVFARGGLGQIRRAFDRVLGRTIAVKEMLAQAGSERFLREAQVTARLDHPAVVPVHDLGVHPDGRPFYCMKLIDGRSLEAIIAATHTLAARILLLPNIVTVAEAIAFAHSRGILHRDLKPANILIGNFGETWIIDWGLAGFLTGSETRTSSITESEMDRAHLTRTGEWMGTLPYMAPEQRDSQTIDQRTDVYGLGAVLYHVLAGQRPYADAPENALLDHITRYPPTDLERLVADVPPDLLAVVRKAMASEAGSRYPDARALADDLQRFLAGRLVVAHTYRLSDVVRRWAHRHRAALIVAVVGLAALGITGIYAFSRIAHERDAAQRNEFHATESKVIAETTRDEAERRSDEARRALARMWEVEGVRRLIDERSPLDARDPLARAVDLAPEQPHLRSILASSERPLKAIRCEAFIDHSEAIFFPPHLPLVALIRGFPSRVELWNTENCTRVDIIHGVRGVLAVGFSDDGAELRWLRESLDKVKIEWDKPDELGQRRIAHVRPELVELVRYNLITHEIWRTTLLPDGIAGGRFGRYGDFAGLEWEEGEVPGSSLMYLRGTSDPVLREIPARRPEVSANGIRVAWLDGDSVFIRDDEEHETRQKIGENRRLLTVSDTGSVLLDGDEDLEIVDDDGSRVALQRCSERPGEGERLAIFGEFRLRFVGVKDQRGDLRLWREATGACAGAVTGRNVEKWMLVGLGDEIYLLTLDGDGRVSIWVVGSSLDLQHVLTLDADESGVFDFNVRELDGAMVTLGRSGTMRAWDLRALVARPAILSAPLIALHPLGNTVAIADAQEIRIVDPLHTTRALTTWPIPQLDALRWEPDGTLTARRGVVLFDWDPTTSATPEGIDVGAVFEPYGLDHDTIAGSSLVVVSGTPASSGARATSSGSELRVYDRRTRDWRELDGLAGGVRHTVSSIVAKDRPRAFLADTGILADTDSGHRVYELSPSAVFTPDGAGVLDIERIGGLAHFDAMTGSRIKYIEYESSLPRRHRVDNFEIFPREPGVTPHPAAAVFSPAADVFAGLGTGPEVTLWSYPEFSRHALLVGHRLPVYDARWSDDGTRVLTRGKDNLAFLWDSETGEPLVELANVRLQSTIAVGAAQMAVQDGPERLTIVDITTGARLFAVAVRSLVDAAFDSSGRRLYLVEGLPGHVMTLRVVELYELEAPSRERGS